jgi:hypothetical protein
MRTNQLFFKKDDLEKHPRNLTNTEYNIYPNKVDPILCYDLKQWSPRLYVSHWLQKLAIQEDDYINTNSDTPKLEQLLNIYQIFDQIWVQRIENQYKSPIDVKLLIRMNIPKGRQNLIKFRYR